MGRVNLLYIIEGGLVGGAEKILVTVIKKIDKTRYRVKACLLKPSDVLEDELKTLGVPIFVLNMTGKWDIPSICRLMFFMRREKIDIVHSSLYASNTAGRIAAILARVPAIIAWEHGEIFTKNAGHCRVDRVLAKFTNCILTCSKVAKEEIIRKERIPSNKIRVIYNCVDLDRFNVSKDTSKATRRDLGVASDEILIGNAGALANEVKGQGYLIRAMPQIIKKFPKAKLLLAGEGPSKSDYIQATKRLNISDKVIFTGFRRDIPEVMSTLDLYVSSSIYETLPISIIEAMYLRKPVVTTDVGGVSEVVIDNETGRLIPAKDVDALADAITSLLSDQDQMRRMGEAGLKRVKEKFSPALIIKEIEKLYKGFL